MGAAPDLSLDPPGTKKPKVVVPFRASEENAAWINSFVKKPHPTQSEIVEWAVGLARSHFVALLPLKERIEALAREEGISETDALAELVERGLAASERKSRK